MKNNNNSDTPLQIACDRCTYLADDLTYIRDELYNKIYAPLNKKDLDKVNKILLKIASMSGDILDILNHRIPYNNLKLVK